MLSLDRAYLCVRDLSANGGPVLPNGWTSQAEAGGWYTLRRNSDGLRILAWRANSVSARGLFALFAPLAVLEAVASVEPACMPAVEAWNRRDEAAVRVFLRRWRHWRIDGNVRLPDDTTPAVTNRTVQLIPEGAAIPDPTVTALPWLIRADGTTTAVLAEAAVRVTAIHRPAMDATVASYALHTGLEDEPARG